MTSKVEVANLALFHLGKDPIVTLTEASAEARKINAIFDSRAKLALSASHWTFARQIEALAELTNDWPQRWERKYQKPVTALTIVRLVPAVDVKNADPVMYDIKGDAIYTDEPEAYVEYVPSTALDPVNWSQPFFDAVAFLLARDLALPLTRKKDVYGEMAQKYKETLSEAIMHDAGQVPTSWSQDASGYLASREGVTSNPWSTSRPTDGSSFWG